MLLVALLAVAVLLLGAGAVTYQRVEAAKEAKAEAAAKARAAKVAKALAAAREEASRVLGKVEECESAVTVGVTLDDLSDKASEAREEALAFSRSEHADVLPEFSSALLRVAEDYTESCSQWFESNEAAEKEWEKAYDAWDVMSDKPAPELSDYRNDSEYQATWAKATDDLATARSLLNSTAQ